MSRLFVSAEPLKVELSSKSAALFTPQRHEEMLFYSKRRSHNVPVKTVKAVRVHSKADDKLPMEKSILSLFF